jgi:hypothetical protein
VYEEGGDFSSDVFNYLLSYKVYVGLKSPEEPNKYGTLETGKSNRFDVVTVDENGKPRAVRDLGKYTRSSGDGGGMHQKIIYQL